MFINSISSGSVVNTLNQFSFKKLSGETQGNASTIEVAAVNGANITSGLPEDAMSKEASPDLQKNPNSALLRSNKESSLMQDNFVSAESGQSKYIAAKIKVLQQADQVEAQSQNQLVSIVSAARMMYDNAESVGEKYKAVKWAEKNAHHYQEKEIVKSAEEGHLKIAKQEIEQGAEEAMAPKDENGEPILDNGKQPEVPLAAPGAGAKGTPASTSLPLGGQNPEAALQDLEGDSAAKTGPVVITAGALNIKI